MTVVDGSIENRTNERAHMEDRSGHVITVVIADDQELVRAGFALVIGTQPDIDVVGQAADGEEAVRLVDSLHPDVVLMDVRMPGTDGLEATRRIAEDSKSDPVTHVIILTTFDLDEYVMAAIRAGASGFLLKDTEPETLLASIRTVYRGNAIIAPSATKRLIEHMAQTQPGPLRDPSAEEGDAAGPSDGAQTGSYPGTPRTGSSGQAPYQDPELDELTAREREVLVEVAHGLSNQEIADRLFISLPTVKTHVAHILQKINARDRVQAVVFAYENDLV